MKIVWHIVIAVAALALAILTASILSSVLIGLVVGLGFAIIASFLIS